MKNDELYLVHIIECGEKIRRYTVGGRRRFLNDEMIQDAVVRNLQTLAESTQRLSDFVKHRRSDVPWRDISELRNILVHYYLAVDPVLIWEIVEKDLPPLLDVIKKLRRGSRSDYPELNET
jgi:uncharacterized protein with HEPN domain